MKRKTIPPVTAPAVFSAANYPELCDRLAAKDKDLKAILDAFGYPPMWTRANTFETLVHIILEQQVSLASALAALNKLGAHIGPILPDAVLALSDEAMRACYISRQKMGYIRGLAEAITSGAIDLEALAGMANDEVRNRLIKLKGIGNWTIDVYLMFVLQRADIFPAGDLAAVIALKRAKRLAPATTKEEVLKISESWKPLRSVACMILWHFYLSDTGRKTAPVA